jgi:hypothetical protein
MSIMSKLLEDHVGKLTIRKVSVDRNEPDEVDPAPIEEYFQIEGSGESLRFLGELLIAFAEGDFGCSFSIHPRGAGQSHFAHDSEFGIDLHKTPCEFGSGSDHR